MNIPVLILWLGLMLMCGLLSEFFRYRESKQWNKGKCPKCNKPWIIVDRTIDYNEYRCVNNHKCIIVYKTDERGDE